MAVADETCRSYAVDGEPVVVRGNQPLDEEGQAALAEVVRAAKKVFTEDHPHAGVVQELIVAARLASWCIPDGMTGARFRLVDGAEVKKRLQAAVQAAREALTTGPAVKAVAESVHPGEILREELRARGLTQLACADMIGRSVRVVNRIIKGRQSITADTALDLEHGLGISAGFWTRLQADHDLHLARQRRAAGGQA
jgi:antitoxin HigA-1